jgi:hypothetical protein
MTYNLSNFTSANNFLDMSIASNQLVDGWLFVFAIMMVFTITFVSLKGYELRQALLTSSFVTFILAASLWGVGILGERSLVVSFVVLVASVIVYSLGD